MTSMNLNTFKDWERAKPFLERSVPELHGTHTIDDICLMVGAGLFKLWTGERSAVLTEFIQMPRLKILNCFLGGGDLQEIQTIRETLIVSFAKENGVQRIQGGGRLGWSRKLPGYTFGGIYMHKDI